MIGRPNSPAKSTNRYIRGEDVSAAVIGVDRLDVNEVNEATHTGLERGEHPGEGTGKGGCGFGIAMAAFPFEADVSQCPSDVGLCQNQTLTP